MRKKELSNFAAKPESCGSIAHLLNYPLTLLRTGS
jgi:hypothetical protein